MLTTEQIETRLNNLEIKVKGIILKQERIISDMANKANLTDLSRRIEEVNELIRVSNISIQLLEEKLSKVILPEATRLYLDEGEVQSFQSNFNTLKAMMTKFNTLYRNLVAYNSNVNS